MNIGWDLWSLKNLFNTQIMISNKQQRLGSGFQERNSGCKCKDGDLQHTEATGSFWEEDSEMEVVVHGEALRVNTCGKMKEASSGTWRSWTMIQSQQRLPLISKGALWVEMALKNWPELRWEIGPLNRSWDVASLGKGHDLGPGVCLTLRARKGLNWEGFLQTLFPRHCPSQRQFKELGLEVDDPPRSQRLCSLQRPQEGQKRKFAGMCSGRQASEEAEKSLLRVQRTSSVQGPLRERFSQKGVN